MTKIIMLTSAPDSKCLGANHSSIGLIGNVQKGIYDDLIVIPEGKFLRIEKGDDKKEGVLFVGKSGYNHGFLTEIRGRKIPSTLTCGCSDEFRKNGFRDGLHNHEIAGAVLIDSMSDGTKEYRELPAPLPNAVAPAWQATDTAGCEEVAFWAVRLIGQQTAYVVQSGYKGRRDWEVRILKSDGTVETVSRDELLGRVRPAQSI